MLTLIAKTVRQNFLFRLYRYYIIDSILIVKKFGFKELLRRRGLKFFLVIVTYYLVRDTLIYIIMPFCIAKGLF
jgi:hypothetical protein